MHERKMCHTHGFPRIISLPLLSMIFVVLISCAGERIPSPPEPLLAAIETCSGSWSNEIRSALTAKYEGLRKGGQIEWKAAMEAGGTLLKYFKDEAKGIEAYNTYIQCVKPALDKFITADQRPKVILVGSKEDYTTYHLSDLESTSAELLDKRLGISFHIIPLTVSYGWSNEESIRAESPDDIVMHASAFHSDQHKEEAIAKFHALVTSLYGLPKTNFLIFSRLPPESPSPDLCHRWKSQVDFLTKKKFRDRLVFYPFPRNESNFTGRAGVEISQIVRCQSGLDAKEFCSAYLHDIEQQARDRVNSSSCT